MSAEKIDVNALGEKIVRVIKTIFDPEIPVDIYELGLIYDVFVNEDYEVKVLMTLTTPNCPVAETLPLEVEEKIKSLDAVKDAEVEITFDPPLDARLNERGSKARTWNALKMNKPEIINRVANSAFNNN